MAGNVSQIEITRSTWKETETLLSKMKSPARLGGKLALQDRSTAPTVVHKLSSSKAPQLQISPALQLYNSLYTALQLCTAPLQHYSATALVQLYPQSSAPDIYRVPYIL